MNNFLFVHLCPRLLVGTRLRRVVKKNVENNRKSQKDRTKADMFHSRWNDIQDIRIVQNKVVGLTSTGRLIWEIGN